MKLLGSMTLEQRDKVIPKYIEILLFAKLLIVLICAILGGECIQRRSINKGVVDFIKSWWSRIESNCCQLHISHG